MNIALKRIVWSRRTFFALIAVFIALVTLNTNILYGQVLIGPKVGARMSWLKYDDFEKGEYKAKPFYGYSGGIATAFKVRKRFFLEVDLLYSRQGKKVIGITDPTLENIGLYHYLNTPIIYRVDFLSSVFNTEFKWFLGIGPNVNFWWKGNGTLQAVELFENNIDQIEYEIVFDKYPDSPEENKLYVEDPNRVQVGLIMASGLVFEPRPNQSILVEFRFEWGHSYIAKGSGIFSDVVAYQDNLRARNVSIQLSVSYMIDILSDGKKEKKIYYK